MSPYQGSAHTRAHPGSGRRSCGARRRRGFLAVDDVAPGRRGGVLQIGHEDLGPGVEGVDDHLAIAGSSDLDPAIEEIAGGGATCQVASRTARVSARNSSSAPASIAVWRSSRARSSSWRRELKRRWRAATKVIASGLRMASSSESTGPWILIPRP